MKGQMIHEEGYMVTKIKFLDYMICHIGSKDARLAFLKTGYALTKKLFSHYLVLILSGLFSHYIGH